MRKMQRLGSMAAVLAASLCLAPADLTGARRHRAAARPRPGSRGERTEGADDQPHGCRVTTLGRHRPVPERNLRQAAGQGERLPDGRSARDAQIHRAGRIGATACMERSRLSGLIGRRTEGADDQPHRRSLNGTFAKPTRSVDRAQPRRFQPTHGSAVGPQAGCYRVLPAGSGTTPTLGPMGPAAQMATPGHTSLRAGPLIRPAPGVAASKRTHPGQRT
jgi:hypothetical protein